jgi:hypothetical protein
MGYGLLATIKNPRQFGADYQDEWVGLKTA